MKRELIERQEVHTDPLIKTEKEDNEGGTDSPECKYSNIIGDNVDIQRHPSKMSKGKITKISLHTVISKIFPKSQTMPSWISWKISENKLIDVICILEHMHKCIPHSDKDASRILKKGIWRRLLDQ